MSYLPMSRHGILSLSRRSWRHAAGDTLSKQRKAGKGLGRVLVIGLGGGALPIYLHDVFSLNVECIDLDETVIRLAKAHFGFEESLEEPRLEVCSAASTLPVYMAGNAGLHV